MNELSKTILNECREEVAKEKGASSFEYYEKHMVAMDNHDYLALAHEQAAELAMDRKWAFMLWTFWTDWIYSDGRFMNSKSGDVLPELELYNIWREGQRNEG